ncbi:single-stranded DNA-binding protein [Demequina sp. NBRC 110055]|uniref:single-stranded DNA-binding protein n=1 Tax=Demequina sp. NBRC 110055 TaxID=1570344 RepID=UPI0009FC2FF1|nr:single-stranded DNA-binding protein [Demequina sp. NBRC 110055]
MRDLEITVTGWAATSPAMVVRRDGSMTDMATFRVAQTPRRFNPSTNEWADGRTEWFDVRVRRDAAALVVSSVEKGQPVVVTGRLRTEEWSGPDGATRWAMRVDATAVGHDLTRGTAKFQRATVDASGEVTPAPPKAEDVDPGEAEGLDELDDEVAKEPAAASV